MGEKNGLIDRAKEVFSSPTTRLIKELNEMPMAAEYLVDWWSRASKVLAKEDLDNPFHKSKLRDAIAANFDRISKYSSYYIMHHKDKGTDAERELAQKLEIMLSKGRGRESIQGLLHKFVKPEPEES